MRLIGCLEDSAGMVANYRRDGLKELIVKAARRVFAHSPLNRAEIIFQEQCVLSRRYGAVNSGGTSTPQRILSGELEGEIQRSFEPPGGHKTSYLQRSNVHDEFFSLELRSQKTLPFVRDLIIRDKLLVVGYDSDGACNSYYVPFTGVDYSGIDLEHTLPGHSQDVILHKIGHIFFAKLAWYVGDVPSLGLSCIEFQRNRPVSARGHVAYIDR